MVTVTLRDESTGTVLLVLLVVSAGQVIHELPFQYCSDIWASVNDRGDTADLTRVRVAVLVAPKAAVRAPSREAFEMRWLFLTSQPNSIMPNTIINNTQILMAISTIA
jgi:hypothetical protein